MNFLLMSLSSVVTSFHSYVVWLDKLCFLIQLKCLPYLRRCNNRCLHLGRGYSGS